MRNHFSIVFFVPSTFPKPQILASSYVSHSFLLLYLSNIVFINSSQSLNFFSNHPDIPNNFARYLLLQGNTHTSNTLYNIFYQKKHLPNKNLRQVKSFPSFCLFFFDRQTEIHIEGSQ